MDTKVHEAMHTSVMAYISGQPMAMGLLPAVDVEVLGASRCAHRLNPNFQKEADSSLGPAINDPWPGIIIEAAWSEGLSHMAICPTASEQSEVSSFNLV